MELIFSVQNFKCYKDKPRQWRHQFSYNPKIIFNFLSSKLNLADEIAKTGPGIAALLDDFFETTHIYSRHNTNLPYPHQRSNSILIKVSYTTI